MSPTSDEARLHYAATARNRTFIADVLESVLPPGGLVLELASGSGEHAMYLARRFPTLVFQPSDPEAECRASIAAWTEAEGLDNVRPPLALDARAPQWALPEAPDALLNVNMIHIAPWHACEGLMAGAGRHLAPGAPLTLYGPYRRGGRHTAPSNEAFDQSLRERDPSWGVRDLEAVEACAGTQGLTLERVVEMPANNLCVVFRRA